jgi:hypothetical protein
MTGHHTSRVSPPEQPQDPERIAIRQALALGKALHDQGRALGRSAVGLAGRADIMTGEIECIEEAGTEPPHCLLRRLATALDTAAHLTAGHHLGPVQVRTPRSLSNSATRGHTKARSCRCECVPCFIGNGR